MTLRLPRPPSPQFWGSQRPEVPRIGGFRGLATRLRYCKIFRQQYQSLGHYGEAIAYDQRAVAIAEGLENVFLTTQAFDNLGSADQGAGRYGETVST
jgi:tetratricopeptide (TPR) repeat protein